MSSEGDPLRGARVLLVEDDPVTVSTLRAYFEAVGSTVVVAEDGAAGRDAAGHEDPDLVLLDIMLPGVDGLTLCRELRRAIRAPILLVSARTAEADVIRGLELGADDYIRKPFSPRELVARARRALVRVRPGGAEVPLVVGSVRLDRAARTVEVDERGVALTRTEFDLLEILMASPGRVFTRGQLLERVSGSPSEAGDRTVDTHLYNLRRKMGMRVGAPGTVSTERGVGYRLVGETS